MLAARLHARGEPLRLEQVPLPEPGEAEIRLAVAGCGVCHTDLHVVDGIQPRVLLPRTLGHEVTGIIAEAGTKALMALRRRRLSVGDAVVVAGGWGCGRCHECLAGQEQRCLRSVAPGFQADGGYAEGMLVPDARHLVSLGDLDPVRAAPLADAGVTPYRAVRRAAPWLPRGGRVLLIGCGGLGQFALQYLRLLPSRDLRIAVRERNPARLERALELGASHALLEGDAAACVDALGGPADVVFDLVGSDETLTLAAGVVRPGGLVMLVGEAGGRLPFGFETEPLEAWFTTVAWASRDDLSAVVRLARAGRLAWDVEPMPLSDANEAHRRLRAGEVAGRIVLVPGG